MSNLHLVTGYAGAAHITPEDHGSLYAAIFGSGSYVLDRGNKLSASAITSNQVRVLDGDMVIQGRHVRLAANSHVDLTIENGAQGVYRNDLIVARYTKSGSTGVEECNLIVIKGTAAASDPQDPEYITGDIFSGGATRHDFPLYRVPLNGLAVGTLVPLFSVAYLVTLGSNGKVPAEYLPAMNYIPNSQKGAASGVATLDKTGKVPSSQLPSMNYIPESQKGVAGGVATLGSDGKIPSSQIGSSEGNGSISSGDVSLSKATCKYYVLGGVCYVSCFLNGTINIEDDNIIFTVSGLPAPKTNSDQIVVGSGTGRLVRNNVAIAAAVFATYYSGKFEMDIRADVKSGDTMYDSIMYSYVIA